MHHWQISHLGMVVPIADAYYMADNPKLVYREKTIMNETAKRMKSNFRKLSKHGMLSPFKFHLFMICPQSILSFAMAKVFKSDFGDRFMYQHTIKAPDEMHRLHDAFYEYIKYNLA